MKKLILMVLCIGVISCKKDHKSVENEIVKLPIETFRAELKINDELSLPFNFKVKDSTHVTVFNAEEVIEVDEITYENDSVYIKLPVFEGVISAKIEDKILNGYFTIPEKNRKMPFMAKVNNTRFDVTDKPNFNIEGIWETTFSPNTEDAYIAKGIFKQNGNKVTGTFRTTTGDYRFLEGVINANKLQLSTFDGAHAFMFTGTVKDSTINGKFYSGNHWEEPFVAKLNPNFELPEPDTLTYLKEGYETLAFTFPDETGKMISLTDDRFKDKVVVVQIMGTWCPNCLDESRYLAEFYKNNNDDLEIVGLAFEYVKTNDKAFKNIKRLRDRLQITYPILLAQTGTSSKQKANEKLPMLNHVLSYPTTIVLGKDGKVKKIHTGFNGPATGEKFTTFKTEFEALINSLKEE